MGESILVDIRWGIGKFVVRPTEIPVQDCKDKTPSSLCNIGERIQTQTEVLQ